MGRDAAECGAVEDRRGAGDERPRERALSLLNTLLREDKKRGKEKGGEEGTTKHRYELFFVVASFDKRLGGREGE